MSKLKCVKLGEYEDRWLTVGKVYDGEQVFGGENPFGFPVVCIEKDDIGYRCYSLRENFIILYSSTGSSQWSSTDA